ncbi:flagellar hook-associated protein FlgL [Paludicola sp. MB14-C6]|uniref:flagellar hook-associated protein FlgL n=1 Tax=Paludihabitans sp. MB14-C6 TaxID=3070656 RepID=UPI0027DC7588|nr:flagellar hook-associated protein FlgL [Paludicola sp. MB14-C6]WMJ24258.1 flagellar hook-associated protein FlgL [Paludicola sp. MB14-C6]
MRVTTGMITAQYSRNLNRSLSKLNYLNNRATTLRKFNRASEDPVAAAKAYSLRRSFTDNDDYVKNLEDTENMMLTAESSMMGLNSIAQEVSSGDMLQAVNGTMSKEDREIIATKLIKMQDAMLSTMNTKYGDRYLFGGSTMTKPPFTVAADGSLLYKGVDVTTGLHQGTPGVGGSASVGGALIDFGAANESKFNDYSISIVNGTTPNAIDTAAKTITINVSTVPTKQDLQTVLQGLTGSTDVTVKGDLTQTVGIGTAQVSGGENKITAGTSVDLKELMNEKMYVDIGLGLDYNANGLNEQSVFDSSLPGINFLGCGVDKNGKPQNMYVLLGQIATELEKPTLDTGATDSLIKGFNNQKQVLLTQITQFGSKTNFLKYADTRLDDTSLNLNKKILDNEFVEPAEAIMDFKMQEFAYMSALQMGTKIIQPTFLDFMR